LPDEARRAEEYDRFVADLERIRTLAAIDAADAGDTVTP